MRALADDPATSHLMLPHRALGLEHARRREFAGARKEFEIVAALSPYYVDGLVDLAAVTAELGDFAAARHRLEQTLALDPNHPHALGLRAKLPPAVLHPQP